MPSEVELKVGSKGEIYLKKNIRKILGIKPHDFVILKVNDGEIILRPKKRFKDIAREMPIKVQLSKAMSDQIDQELQDALEN